MVETMNGKAWYLDEGGGYAHQCRALRFKIPGVDEGGLITLCGRRIHRGVGSSLVSDPTHCPRCEKISEAKGST